MVARSQTDSVEPRVDRSSATTPLSSAGSGSGRRGMRLALSALPYSVSRRSFQFDDVPSTAQFASEIDTCAGTSRRRSIVIRSFAFLLGSTPVESARENFAGRGCDEQLQPASLDLTVEDNLVCAGGQRR